MPALACRHTLDRGRSGYEKARQSVWRAPCRPFSKHLGRRSAGAGAHISARREVKELTRRNPEHQYRRQETQHENYVVWMVFMSKQPIPNVSSQPVLDSYPHILRTRAVLAIIGLSRTSLWRRVRSGDFPAPVRLGGEGSRAVGWRRADVERWLDSLHKA